MAFHFLPMGALSSGELPPQNDNQEVEKVLHLATLLCLSTGTSLSPRHVLSVELCP